MISHTRKALRLKGTLNFLKNSIFLKKSQEECRSIFDVQAWLPSLSVSQKKHERECSRLMMMKVTVEGWFFLSKKRGERETDDESKMRCT